MPSQHHLNRAIDLAVTHHGSETDKAGAHYLMHLFRVMLRCDGFDAKVCAMLHDLVEDHGEDIGFDDLAEEFPPHIIEALRCVTKLSDEEDYEAFMDRVLSNPLATRVKLADLEDNLDVKRLSQLGDRDLARTNKYLVARQRILSAL